MGKVLINSGGSSVDLDVVTAESGDVLSGKVIVDKDGNPLTGTLQDYSDTAKSATASLDATNSRLQMTVPETGKYSAESILYATYYAIRTLIGLTKEKIATGNTILGLDGTYKGLGDAATGDVLSGKKFSTASLSNAGGSMKNNGAVSKTFTPGNSSQSYTIPAGYHNGSGKVACNAVSNLSAGNIKKGVTVGGVAGSFSGTMKTGTCKAPIAHGYTESGGTSHTAYTASASGFGITPTLIFLFGSGYYTVWKSSNASYATVWYGNAQRDVKETNEKYFKVAAGEFILPIGKIFKDATLNYIVIGY